MRDFRVAGRVKATGGNITLTIPAKDEAEAIEAAGKKGIVVSRVTAVGVTESPPLPSASVPSVLAYRAPSKPSKLAAPQNDYPEIAQGNRLLKLAARVLMIFGWIGIVAAVIGLIGAIIALVSPASANSLDASNRLAASLAISLVGLCYAIASFVGAIILKMYGALAMAVRDIAVNTAR